MLDLKSLPDAAEGFDAKLRGLGLPLNRRAQPKGKFTLPEGLTVVAADTHYSIGEDIFYQKFPAHLKHRAPRLVVHDDTYCDWNIEGKLMSQYLSAAVKTISMTFETMPGSSRIEPRLLDMDAEGIDKEIAFGNEIGFFFGYPDLELREAVFRAYNEHLADLQAKAPGRFYGVGLLNYWDMSRVRESLAELKQLGLKTFQLPLSPKGANGKSLNYCASDMDPLWTAIEESGLPACFHVGEGTYTDEPGGIGVVQMVNFGPLRKSLGEMIFGGVFDRHPALQTVFVEAEINWVPGAIQTAGTLYEHCNHLLNPVIKHHPRYYWHNNCYATFMHDTAGLRLLDIVGTDRVMWTSDYPHQESTWGFSWSAMQEVLDSTSEKEARMILGGTAQKLFGI